MLLLWWHLEQMKCSAFLVIAVSQSGDSAALVIYINKKVQHSLEKQKTLSRKKHLEQKSADYCQQRGNYHITDLSFLEIRFLQFTVTELPSNIIDILLT